MQNTVMLMTLLGVWRWVEAIFLFILVELKVHRCYWQVCAVLLPKMA